MLGVLTFWEAAINETNNNWRFLEGLESSMTSEIGPRVWRVMKLQHGVRDDVTLINKHNSVVHCYTKVIE